jgi:hypothetical protein
MRVLMAFAIGLLGVWQADAQSSLRPEVFATAGDHFATGSAQISWTLGEPVIETYAPAGGSAQLNQGFHQTNLSIVAADDPLATLQVRVYPNPTSSWIRFEAHSDAPAFGITLSDAQGRILLSQAATALQDQPHTLDLSDYSPGVYLLHLFSQDGKSYQTFSIVKHN